MPSRPEIVHQANLKFSMVDPHICMLTKNGMLDTSKESRVVYQTTPKVEELLKDYKKIESEIWGGK